jgi:hypothetical protein
MQRPENYFKGSSRVKRLRKAVLDHYTLMGAVVQKSQCIPLRRNTVRPSWFCVAFWSYAKVSEEYVASIFTVRDLVFF